MNVVKLGVSLRHIYSFDSILAANLVQRIYSVSDGNLLLRIFGYDQLLALKVIYKPVDAAEEKAGSSQSIAKAELSFDGVDLPPNFRIKTSEEILCLQETSFREPIQAEAADEEQLMEIDTKDPVIPPQQTTSCLIFATESSLKLMSVELDDTVFFQWAPGQDQPLTHV